jgi:A/G-specific adenine glycosylase
VPFSDEIISWYIENKRDLPWRNTNNPYKIWLSEIILQQTRVSQGLPYYQKFVDEFPDIHGMAEAAEQKVLKLWQGLGYYSRARNMHQTANVIVREYNGHFPKNYLQLLTLKGVGEYTAAAIASMAFNLPHAVVDGNVFRVLSRIFGISTPVNTTVGKKIFYSLANDLIDKANPGLFNQAIMEFGATCCLPVKPKCELCPLSQTCYAFNNNVIASLPVKESKAKVKNLHINYFVLSVRNKTIIRKRSGKGIWQNLFDFPSYESEQEVLPETLIGNKEINSLFKINNYQIISVSEVYKHVLTHRNLFVRFWEIETSEKPENKKGWSFINFNEIEKYPVPRIIDKYLTVLKDE